jgi:hypothetical protein
MVRAAVRAPADRKHGLQEIITLILHAAWDIFFIECLDKKPGYSRNVAVFLTVQLTMLSHHTMLGPGNE